MAPAGDIAVEAISVEDWVEIANLIGKYQWLVDAGDPKWAELFTEDGAFLSQAGEGYRGREQLRAGAASTQTYFAGAMRHSPSAIHIGYGESRDEATARYYSLVTTWFAQPGPDFFNMALCTASLVRVGGDWKFKTNTMNGLYRAL
jgi:hypothetical protein